MLVRTYSQILGVVFVALGLFSFYAPFRDTMQLATVHGLVYFITGMAALTACTRSFHSTMCCRMIGVVYLLLGLAGLFSSQLMGVMSVTPILTVIHLVVGISASALGFFLHEDTIDRNTPAV